MFFRWRTNLKEKNIRKDKLSPVDLKKADDRRRTFFFASQKASLTVEAALAVPVFLFCMCAVLHISVVYETAARFGSALCETAEEMAVNAYATVYQNGSSASSLLTGGLSLAYADRSVFGKAGNKQAVKNANLLLSSFLEEGDEIKLVLTYQVRTPVPGIHIPGIIWTQKSCVRAWVGREGSGGEKEDNQTAEEKTQVYVTEHGKVYHTDLNCSHIKLSISMVSKDELPGLRNSSGGKYYCCEHCGAGASGEVYITKDGDRYHSSLSCSGLKRTINTVDLDTVGEMRPCHKCGG